MTDQPGPENSGGTCVHCGDRYVASSLRKAAEWHDEDHPDHPYSITIGGGWLVVTEGTIREVERPSGAVADRDDTGGNDRYSNS